MYRDLQSLYEADRKRPAPLYGLEILEAHSSRVQFCGEQIGGGYRILNGQIDTDPTHGRHRVRGIADAK
jgi:hypothetical protein